MIILPVSAPDNGMLDHKQNKDRCGKFLYTRKGDRIRRKNTCFPQNSQLIHRKNVSTYRDIPMYIIARGKSMTVKNILSRWSEKDQVPFSFEFFPPKTDKGWENL